LACGERLFPRTIVLDTDWEKRTGESLLAVVFVKGVFGAVFIEV